MSIIKGLLTKPGEGILDDEDELPHPYAGAEAALDAAIRQRQAGASEQPVDWSKVRAPEDRRQSRGPRPDGLPDRRSGFDRRNGGDRRGAALPEFGRRSARADD